MNSLCCVCSLCLPSFLSLFPLLLRLLFLPSLYYFSHFPLYSPWYLLSTCIIFSPSLTPLSFFSYLFCLYPHDFYLRPRQLLNCPEKLLSKKNEEPAINCTIFWVLSSCWQWDVVMNVSGLMASGSGSAGGDRLGTDKHSGFFVPSRGFGHRVNCC